MDNSEIRKAVFGVVVDRRLLTRDQMETKYADLIREHKPLYEYALDPTADVQQMIRILDTMLEARSKVSAGTMKKLDAEMYVGNKLGKEFIYDKVKKPSSEEYLHAVNKLNELSKNGGDISEELSKNVTFS